MWGNEALFMNPYVSPYDPHIPPGCFRSASIISVMYLDPLSQHRTGIFQAHMRTM